MLAYRYARISSDMLGLLQSSVSIHFQHIALRCRDSRSKTHCFRKVLRNPNAMWNSITLSVHIALVFKGDMGIPGYRMSYMDRDILDMPNIIWKPMFREGGNNVIHVCCAQCCQTSEYIMYSTLVGYRRPWQGPRYPRSTKYNVKPNTFPMNSATCFASITNHPRHRNI